MSKQSKLVFVFIFVFISVAYIGRNSEDAQKLKKYQIGIQPFITEYKYEGLARSYLDLFLKDSKYRIQWQINEPIDDSKLNIYFLDFSKFNDKNKSPFEGAIAFVEEINSIIIDIDSLKSLVSKSGLLDFPNPNKNPYIPIEINKKVEKDIYAKFLFWILGHEIGHLVNSHGTNHFYSLINKNLSNIDEEQIRAEYEADDFFVETLQRKLNSGSFKEEEISEILRFYNNYFAAQHELTMGSTGVAGPMINLTGVQGLRDVKMTTHPEFFIRAGRVLSILDHPNNHFKSLYAENIPRIERHIINNKYISGLLSVSGEPFAFLTIFGSNGNEIYSRTGAMQWLEVGQYRAEIYSMYYQPKNITFEIHEDKTTEVRYVLSPEPKYEQVLAYSQRLEQQSSFQNELKFSYDLKHESGLTDDAVLWEVKSIADRYRGFSRALYILAVLNLLKDNCDSFKLNWKVASKLENSDDLMLPHELHSPLSDITNLLPLISGGEHSDEDLLNLSHRYMLIKEETKARKALDTLMERGTKDYRISTMLSLLAYEDGDLDAAEKFIRASLAEKDTSVFEGTTSYYEYQHKELLGRVLEESSKYLDAEDAYLENANSNSRHLPVILFYYRFSYQHKLFSYLDKLVREGDNSSNHCQELLVGVGLGRLEYGDSLLQNIHELDYDCRVNLARSYIDNGAYSLAKKLCDFNINHLIGLSDRTKANFYYCKSIIEFDRFEFEKSKEYIESAFWYRPEDVSLLEHYYNVLIASKKKSAASCVAEVLVDNYKLDLSTNRY